MNVEYFIAKRLVSSRESGNRLSRLMSIVAVVSIALGIAVMILTVAIVTGFKSQISHKLAGGNSHIRITNLDSNYSFETNPVAVNQELFDRLNEVEGIKHVQKFITKGGIIKTEYDNQGVMFKGIGADFDTAFFAGCITEGRVFTVSDTATTNNVLISKKLAQLLRLKLGDRFDAHFVQDPPRVRRFTVCGIYSTQLEEIDRTLVLCDIKHLQKIYGWSENQVSGLEISIDDIENIETLSEEIDDLVAFDTGGDGLRLAVDNVLQLYPHLFAWLDLLDTNVAVILLLTIAVAGFNMVSGLLIMLLERTSMIGILKSLGMKNADICRLFLYRTAFIAVKGLIAGNIIGMGCCMLQQSFGIIKLDAASYFVETVPINLDIVHLILLNLSSALVIALVLAAPLQIIAKISPEKTIRFE
ncbi:MAG: ABC transporter permease [Prevotellaceae bacterium]|jgi:lipoprotein-releasing system permease protein|nr:ABC transporter permease [Prevotellaceae bacterium]